jgi:FAD/FMN-containing dehydrogenase
MDAALISALMQRVRAGVISRSHPDNDVVRRGWNGKIDRFPLAIARPDNAAEVAAAMAFERENDFPLSVRGVEHGVAGKTSATASPSSIRLA